MPPVSSLRFCQKLPFWILENPRRSRLRPLRLLRSILRQAAKHLPRTLKAHLSLRLHLRAKHHLLPAKLHRLLPAKLPLQQEKLPLRPQPKLLLRHLLAKHHRRPLLAKHRRRHLLEKLPLLLRPLEKHPRRRQRGKPLPLRLPKAQLKPLHLLLRLARCLQKNDVAAESITI